MSTQRRIVRKIENPFDRGFDTQFWPVVVAMCILTAVLIGAVIALFSGIAMWISLMVLPAGLGISLAVFRLIEHRIIRRSVQFAAILSMAIHVILILFMIAWHIFSIVPENEIAASPPSKQKPIRVTFRNPTPVVEPEIVEKPIEPEPKVVEKTETQPTETTKTANPVKTMAQTQNESSSQRQNRTQPTVPKMGRSLAKLSRQPSKNRPKANEMAKTSAAASKPSSSSEPAPAKTEVTRTNPSKSSISKSNSPATAANQPSPATPRQNRTQPAPSENRLADSKASRSNNRPQVQPKAETSNRTGSPGASLSRVTASTNEPSPAATVNRKTTESKPEVARKSPAVSSKTVQPSKSSTARNERSRPRPAETVQRTTPQINRNRNAQRPLVQPATSQPSTKSQTTVAKTNTPSRTVEIQRQSTNNTPSENMRRTSNPSTNVVEQRPMEQTPRRTSVSTPSINSNPVANAQPRRAKMTRPQVQSTQNVEAPSMANTNSTKGSSQISPRPLALNKGETGTAGSGSSANLNRANGPKVSPAQMPSNSSRRNVSRSRPNQTRSLASKQQSQINQSRTGAPVPQQVVKMDSQIGSVAGTPSPKQMNASSSASIQSASSDSQRGEVSSEKGSASVDIGPTKIVADQNSTRAGGGGQPQLSQQSIAATSKNDGSGPPLKPSVSTSNSTNSVAAPQTTGTAANHTQNPSPNSKSSIAQRQSNAPASVGNPSDTELKTEPGATNITGSSNNQRSNRSSNQPSSAPSLASSDKDNSNQRNPNRQVIAQLPSNNNGSKGDNNQSEPTTDQSQSGLVANTETQKQQTGTMSVDRADRGSLTQANNSNDAEIANSSNRRASRLGSNQVSEMIVGQSSIDKSKLSPVIGSTPGKSETPIAANPGGGSTGETTPSRRGDIVRSSGGTSGSNTSSPSQSNIASTPSKPSTTSSSRAGGSGNSIGEMKVVEIGSGPGKSSNTPIVQSSGNQGKLSIPSSGFNPASQSNTGNDRIADANKQSTGGMKLDVPANPGAGGFAAKPDERIGVNSVRASRDSDSVQIQPVTRFRTSDRGNKPQLSSSVVVAKKPFSSRRRKRMEKQTPETAKAIELGLAFLARQQNEDGSWSLEKLDRARKESKQQLVSDTAATGLALLAFQGAGFNHKEYFYSEKLNRAITFLIENQKENGNLYIESDKNSNESCRLYSHGIATLALTEAYGMTQDPKIKKAAQKAIDFIQKTQDKNFGGWRYYATPVSMRRSDTSVTGWMVMALQSGRLAGLDVEKETFNEIERFLGYAKDSKAPYQFRYNPNASRDDPKTAKHLKPTRSMTAVGLLMKMYRGWNRNDQRLLSGSDYLLEKLPDNSSETTRDTYYWYYATQVMNHVGGNRWNRWKKALEPMLIKSQVKDGKMAGSWDPYYPVPDRWGSHGGRIYVTTLNLLNLEVEYRKLPLYVETGK